MFRPSRARSLLAGLRARARRFGLLGRGLLLRCLVVYCVAATAPGAAEAASDLVHFVCAGHTVHSLKERVSDPPFSEDDDAEHEHEPGADAEHGCSGFFHVCHCCSQAQVLPSSVAPGLVGRFRPGRQPLAFGERGALPGYRAPPFRPPSV